MNKSRMGWRVATTMALVLAAGSMSMEAAAQGQDGGSRGGFRGQPGQQGGNFGRGQQAGGGAFFGGGGAGAGSQYSARDLPTIIRALSLDEAQQDVVGAILDEHDAAVRASTQAIRDQFQQQRDNGGQGGRGNFDRDQITMMMADVRAKQRRLDMQLEGDLQAVLYENQRANWVILERELRREHTIRQGQLSGESVDLFALVQNLEVNVDETPGLSTTLEQYAAELDPALKARNDANEANADAMREAFQSRDTDKIKSFMEKQTRLRTAVRDINMRYADEVAGNLDAEKAAEFHEAFKVEAYRRVYSPTGMTRAFEAALEFEDVDASTRQSIETLQQQYSTELDSFNERLVALVQTYEPKQQSDRIERMMARMTGGTTEDSNDPLSTTYEQRNELDARYRTQLEAVLTPEQVAALPRTRGPRGQVGGNFGGGPGGGRGGFGGGGRGG